MVQPVWTILCLSVLAYAWLNRDVSGTDEAVIWALAVLTFPIALTLSTLASGVLYTLHSFANVSVPGGFGFNLAFWSLSVSLGYRFWFGLIPRISRDDGNPSTDTQR